MHTNEPASVFRPRTIARRRADRRVEALAGLIANEQNLVNEVLTVELITKNFGFVVVRKFNVDLDRLTFLG